MSSPARVGSLFAGIGGFDLAAVRAGMTVAWQSENDRHASKVLAHHWPDVPNYGDIHDLTGPPTVDVLTGGFPCQDYSVAGKGAGLAGDRGALWWQFHRVIDLVRPAWVVGENVHGLTTNAHRESFATIIGSLVRLGYGVVWRVFDAQYFGVAQRRRRVFIVGHSGGQPRPEVLALTQGVSGDTPPSRETGTRVAALTANGLGGGGPDDNLAQGGHLIAFSSKDYGADAGESISDPPGDEPRRIAPERRRGRRAVAAPQLERHGDLAAEVDPDGLVGALRAGDGGSSRGRMVAFAQNQRDELRDLDDKAGALAAEPGMKQQTYVAYPLQHVAADERRQNGSGVGAATDPSYALDQMSRHGVATRSTVRRLTPLECERLQGFPDGWTAIPGNSDSQRYKQLGNAVAVPVAEWIMRRIGAA